LHAPPLFQAAARGVDTSFTNTAVGVGTLQAPYDGVIVRWRMKLQSGGGSFTHERRRSEVHAADAQLHDPEGLTRGRQATPCVRRT